MEPRRFLIFAIFFLFCDMTHTLAHELSNELAVENYFFLDSAHYENQERSCPSISIQPEYYHLYENGLSLTASLFGRYDYVDSERSHIDVRELIVNCSFDSFEIDLGIGKTFWGATEFYHLLDIINQTDLVESIDGEEKLGQPMFHLLIAPDWGNLDFYVLPYFRERTFPGKDGRFRSSLVVDTENAVYKSSAGQHHLDFAVRYNQTFGDMDFGVYYFNGTNRIPQLQEETTVNADNVLIPYYDQIQQFGTDIQFVSGSWLYKYEGIYQNGGEQDYFAFTGGVEYTFQSILYTNMDLGVICEYAYDDRENSATTAFDNDLMIGLRWVTNNQSSVEVLTSLRQDLQRRSRVMTAEINGRISERIKFFLEAAFFSDIGSNDYLYTIRNDDYVSMEVRYYF